MADFLPLCDLLFNVVSLAAYFCDVVFHILTVYALYQAGRTLAFAQSLTAIIASTVITQILSLYWHLSRKPTNLSKITAITVHSLQLGILWRYARLLVPVNLTNVKLEVRDLCILRLVHGFMQSAPMLLIQLSLLPTIDAPPKDLIKVSAALSLFSVCWGLASFSKHVQNVDRLILTWLGVLSQLFWRAGTVTARAVSLSAYATAYHEWIFLVLTLHWICMFLWLISPRNTFNQGNHLFLSFLMSGVYVFSYVNLHDQKHARSMVVFYTVMLLENSLLIGAWIANVYYTHPGHIVVIPVLCAALYGVGILFMLIYYKYFHVQRLLDKPPAPPGVFNCRFTTPNNAALNRKKKKPTSFVPPPGLNTVSVPFWRRPLPSSSENDGSSVGSRVNIHQKLQEKKQKQLAELKIIEEEIKQGKLVGPQSVDPDDRQPIPRAKRHLEPTLLSLASLNNLASYGVNLNRRPAPRAPRSRTPELLLAPRYLYCDCALPEPEPVELPGGQGSDLESQISLPRSYTLPREFKYYRRGRTRKPVCTIASTNSSDGDVDSAEDESDCHTPPAVVRPLRRPFRHETKL